MTGFRQTLKYLGLATCAEHIESQGMDEAMAICWLHFYREAPPVLKYASRGFVWILRTPSVAIGFFIPERPSKICYGSHLSTRARCKAPVRMD